MDFFCSKNSFFLQNSCFYSINILSLQRKAIFIESKYKVELFHTVPKT